MRLRRQPILIERVKSHPWRMEPLSPGKWKEEAPIKTHFLALEIGSGKGGFLAGVALQNPESFLIGLEKVPEVVWQACKKMEELQVKNARLLQKDARDLTTLFAPGEVDRIYLNFSDPWPKTRHAKRRLTYRSFLNLYHQILAPNGEVHFKTDNRALFEFSLNEFSALGLKMKNISLNLHGKEPEDNVRTEYESKFSQLGFPIFRVEVSFPSGWSLDQVLKEEKEAAIENGEKII